MSTIFYVHTFYAPEKAGIWVLWFSHSHRFTMNNTSVDIQIIHVLVLYQTVSNSLLF